jgi:hypothetical protein
MSRVDWHLTFDLKINRVLIYIGLRVELSVKVYVWKDTDSATFYYDIEEQHLVYRLMNTDNRETIIPVPLLFRFYNWNWTRPCPF